MEHKMRRFRQQLSDEEADRILKCRTNGILSLIDPDGSPYGVPVSYAYDNSGHIYIHCAASGRKMDCIVHDSRCSFCVVAQDEIVPEEFTTYFRSVILSGVIRILSDPAEILDGLVLLCDKYCPGIDPSEELERSLKAVRVLRIDIDNITGKESIELVRNKH